MLATNYFSRHLKNGRAVLKHHTKPDVDGVCDPRLWLIALNGHMCACDSDLFFEVVSPRHTVEQVMASWREYRYTVLLERRRSRAYRRRMKQRGAAA